MAEPDGDPDVLSEGERPVNDLVLLGPTSASKHLRVLREVGAVDVRARTAAAVSAERPKPIDDWVKSYENSWSSESERLDVALDDLEPEHSTSSRRN